MKIRQHIKVSGWVQGVGFRYRTKNAALRLGITGWVRNEWDGSVEMEVQGTLEEINEMFVLITQSPYIRIENMERTDIPIEGHEAGFHN